MMLKACGAFLVLLGGIGLLCYLLQVQKLHTRGLMDMKNSLHRIDQKVNYLGIPIPVIVEEEAEELSGELGHFYQILQDRLKHTEEESLEDMLHGAWQETVRRGSIYTLVEQETYQEALLISFRQKYTGNARALESYFTAMEDLIIENRAFRQRDRKLTVTMTMMGTAAILCLLM